jgi:hypothetical protein
LKEKVMKRRFEFEVLAECEQFLLHDSGTDAVKDHLDWTDEASERLLAVGEGTLAVGTIHEGFISVVVEIADSEPDEDMSRWDQVNEATKEVPSGRLIVAGMFACCRMFDQLIWNQVHTEPGCITEI